MVDECAGSVVAHWESRCSRSAGVARLPADQQEMCSEMSSEILSLDIDDVFVIKIVGRYLEPALFGSTDYPKSRFLLSLRRYMVRRRLTRLCHVGRRIVYRSPARYLDSSVTGQSSNSDDLV
eukprot:IDg16661t1